MKLRRLLVLLATLFLLVPSAAATATEPLPEGAIPLPGGGYALELKAETPDWYTDELHQQVLSAGSEGVPVPASAGPEFSSLAFTGIRPGAWMFSPAWCTMNFVFGSEGDYYIGTAGHCASVGDEVVLIAAPGVLMNIGVTVKSYDNGIGQDFALVDIYDEMQEFVNPSMSYWAGPTGTAQPVVGDAVVHSGHGLVIGTGGTPRVGVVTYVGPGEIEGGPAGGDPGDEEGNNGNGCGRDKEREKDEGQENKGEGNGCGRPEDGSQEPEEEDEGEGVLQANLIEDALMQATPGVDTAYGWDGAANLGDSGSGVRDVDGTAAGNLTHLVVGTEFIPAFIVGTTAPYIEQLAGLPIATATLVPDPLY